MRLDPAHVRLTTLSSYPTSRVAICLDCVVTVLERFDTLLRG